MKRIRPTSVAALVLAAAIMASGTLAWGQSANRLGGATGPLIYSITPRDLSEMLTDAGYSIVERGPNYLLALSLNDQLILVQLFGCAVRGCEGVRAQTRWILGERQSALEAARSYEHSVPLAYVSFARDDLGVNLFVGRDIGLIPGRTRRNLLFQIGMVDRMAESVTSLLIAEDPGILEYWEEMEEALDE